MRIKRILLENYRGIERHELVLTQEGDVTVIQGPNEVGKSSLSEAIDVLFECKDDSRARRVRSLQPVGRDVGTLIEIEITSGAYELTYRKQYHRERLTELTVHAPVPESWTGREAHDRARQILEETVDVALWKALRIHQGRAISQASVGQNTSLATALDHASGSSTGSVPDENESLFEAVTGEFLRYFTATGRERRELGEMRAELERVGSRAASLEEKRASLDEDVARCERLSAEVDRLSLRERELSEEALARREEIRALEALQERVEATRLRWETARGALELARERLAQYEERARRGQDLATERNRLEGEAEKIDADLATLRAELAEGESLLQRYLESEERTRSTVDIARIDYEHWSDREELEELGKRKERVQRAREEATDAQALLATSRVTTEVVDRIREAYNQLLVTRAVVQSKSPSLKLEVLTDLSLEVGGERIDLPAGEVREDTITAPLDITVPGLLRVSIEPGEDLAEVRRTLDQARNEYMSACQEIGVDDLETAHELLKQRQRAEVKIAERDRTMHAELGEGWTEALEGRQGELKQRVFAYLRERGPAEPMPESRESALARLRVVEGQLEETRCARESVATRTGGQRARAEELEARRLELATRMTQLVSEVESERVAAAAGAAGSDLARNSEEATAREREMREQNEGALAELEGRGPDTLRERAANTEAALAKVRREIRDVESELSEVSTRVKILCEEGLLEQYDAVESERLHLARELTSLEARARAASTLFHTMRTRREEVRRAYVRPLTERIESLGRIVFGPDLSVEIDDELRLESRTLGGKTLPFDALSTGAREQLGIIARLACAMIVAEDGSGVPVILDDALGYSDPERLREMGAVLAVAGRELQVIVLTSVPDRYLHVGGARVVRL